MPLDRSRFNVGPLATAGQARAEVAAILLPPPDLDVHESAERYRFLENPGGGYSGPWRNPMAPYTVAPMRACSSQRYEIVVFVAPAQTAKTEIGLNFICHSVVVDPADFQIVLPEKQLAKDFSTRRLERMTLASPEMAARLRGSSEYLFEFDGCLVNLSWPTSSNASSKPVPRNWLDERDSMDDDIDGEGDPTALYHKRSTTFGARGITLVTSSPKRPKTKGAAKPIGKHEAPTCDGVVANYNQGTRRRYYWPCKECGEFFCTRFADLVYPETARSDDVKIPVVFACPSCGTPHDEEDRRGLWDRASLAHNEGWLAEGEEIAADGTVTGAPRHTNIDSYWLYGPQAAFITLEKLVRKYLAAKEKREATGSETDLRTFWNVDAGEIYESENEAESLSPDDLRKAAADLPAGVLPGWTAFTTAAIDVQGDRFEFQTHAHGAEKESIVVDHGRLIAIAAGGKPVIAGAGGGGAVEASNLEAVDPATNGSDWLALIPAVFDKPIPLEGDTTRGLLPSIVAIDTGGKSGTTAKAYAFARYLRKNRPDLYKKAVFIKGASRPNPVLVWRSQWDPKTTPKRTAHADDKTKTTNRKGVDLWFVSTDLVKDSVVSRLRRGIKAKGARAEDSLRLSRNLPASTFDQMCAETANEDGEWVNERKVANEAFDLAVYNHAGFIKLGGYRINWQNPPAWAIADKMAVPIANAIAANEQTEQIPAAAPVKRRRSFSRFAGRL